MDLTPTKCAAVLDYWTERTGRKIRSARVQAEAHRLIRARMVADGYTVEQLKQAVDGALADPYYVQEGFLGFDNIFRSGKRVEKLLDTLTRAKKAAAATPAAPGPPPPRPDVDKRPPTKAERAAANEAAKRGVEMIRKVVGAPPGPPVKRMVPFNDRDARMRKLDEQRRAILKKEEDGES